MLLQHEQRTPGTTVNITGKERMHCETILSLYSHDLSASRCPAAGLVLGVRAAKDLVLDPQLGGAPALQASLPFMCIKGDSPVQPTARPFILAFSLHSSPRHQIDSLHYMSI